MEFLFGRMDVDMKDFGPQIERMGKENVSLLMVMHMKVIGLMIELMDMVNIRALTETTMKGGGLMISKMGKEKKYGSMALHM